jgi:hypothetical protein
MAIAIQMGATMMCSFGVAPASLVVIPGASMLTPAMPSANSSAFAPIVNVPPFGACSSPSNPVVAAATAAALGVLTPMPCVPATTSPWVPGATAVINGPMPAVDVGCKLTCMWGGVISVLNPGQTTLMVR